MSAITLIFPHQLFEDHPALQRDVAVVLVEELLFFQQYPFHQHKIAYHRATMKSYEAVLLKKKFQVRYVEAHQPESDVRVLIAQLAREGVSRILAVDPTDDWLERRMLTACRAHQIIWDKTPSPLFLNTPESLTDYFDGKKRFFQTSFYIGERKRLGVLIDKQQQPIGGQWTFDADNRKKFPKTGTVPEVHFPSWTAMHDEARLYTQKHFGDHYGGVNRDFFFPVDHAGARKWLEEFLAQRFRLFGDYEDAIPRQPAILFHSALTPMLNIGLLRPEQVVDAALDYAKAHAVPLNALEGLIRQVIGWREFMRGMYAYKGREMRVRNFWNFKRPMPSLFYNATTGILPVDTVISKVLKNSYCHHIERLMVLGNFMLLCEIDPDAVYQWFMELFIDAYDWVMVPNVYGMSQFADGGLFATKPYISGSNYIMKMGDYPKGNWQVTWDGLFWRFMDKHRSFFQSNPRLNMLVQSFDKMPVAKREAHHLAAEKFLSYLDANS
ncbi:MAG: cryptochrome/photolyase family protein [Chitinophagales bacterium]